MEKDWAFSHLDLHVKDLQAFVDYYKSIGIGVHVTRLEWPDAKSPYRPPPEALKPKSLTFRNREPVDEPARTTPEEWAQLMTSLFIGSAHVEVISSPGRKAGSIGHIAFNVPNLRRETQRLLARGCEIIYAHITDTFVGENIIDTGKFGSVQMQFRLDPDGSWSEAESAWIASRGASSGSSNWKFHGMGIGVRDMDEVVAYYQFLGLGTFRPEVMFDSSSIADFEVDGKTPDTPVKARTRLLQVGPVVYEFVQPHEGDTLYKESLDRRGDGVADFAFTVDDLDEETAKLAEKGVPVIRSGNPRNGGAFAYLDTRKVGDMMIKLIQA